jgi:serine/threonine protein kinase/tetratricopeptide (TPR) repeat protein
MGEVYRARDTRLKREVALKILPPVMAADPERLARFRREAETVAGLNHPNIVTLHSVEHDAGVHFLTMELVEGESLDLSIASGRLDLPRVLEIGAAVADALEAAHARGVVHRDLKPGNVMVTRDGRVKVLDFGLAKLSRDAVEDGESADDIDLTREGSAVGTVPYMSPEQLRGREFDHRSDLFSLGVLLYEMVSGQRPFAGDSNVDVSLAIIRDTPPVLSEIEPSTPPELGRLVAECLEKQPDARPPSAASVQGRLAKISDSITGDPDLDGETISMPRPAAGRRRFGRWAGIVSVALLLAVLLFVFGRNADNSVTSRPGATVAEEKPSIAVLAFVNMSGDPGNEYFSDGISEELLNLLAKLPELRVISRSSAFSFKNQNLEVPEIARRLDVAHILEGSVRKDGNRVRVTAQLIEARTDSHLWSETYDRTLDDIFAVQDEIAAAVVGELEVALLGSAPRIAETDPEGYALFLQGRHLGGSLTPSDLAASIEIYQQVLTIDPDYAPAWDGLAAAYLNQTNNGLRPADEGYDLARRAAENALTIDPDYAPAHESLAWISLWHDNDLRAAAGHTERALALDPTHLSMIRTAATVLDHLGRPDEAVALGVHVTARDPVSSTGHTHLGHSYLYSGRWQDAATSYRTALRLNSDEIGSRYNLGLALLFGGRPEDALAEFAAEEDPEWNVKGQALALYAMGRRDEFDAKMAELIEGWGDKWPSEVAHVAAFSGDADATFAWLERAIAIDEAGLTEQFLLPFYEPVTADPRWRAFLERVGSTPEQLASIVFDVDLPI